MRRRPFEELRILFLINIGANGINELLVPRGIFRGQLVSQLMPKHSDVRAVSVAAVDEDNAARATPLKKPSACGRRLEAWVRGRILGFVIRRLEQLPGVQRLQVGLGRHKDEAR